MFKLVFVNIVCICYVNGAIAQEVVVNTMYGKLRGTRRQKMNSVGGNVDYVDEFLGVPYAQPPVGDLRLRAPVPSHSWDGVRNATSHGSVCLQSYTSALTIEEFKGASENCLYLNIHAPFQTSASQLLYPVMMYIHGGSYGIGAGNPYTGFFLAHNQVVVVSINYRLNFLGFFTTADMNAPGNYGFLDQIEAMKWIRDNVVNFRGDPQKVTIFGSSSGASSVGLHLVSAPSRGLFQRAIMQSGSPVGVFAYTNKREALKQFATKAFATFKCAKPHTWSSVQCLKKAAPQKLVELDAQPKNTNALLPFSIPWIDGAVLPALPATLFNKGDYDNVPVMIGDVMDESSSNVLELLSGLKNADTKLSDGIDYDTLERGIRSLVKMLGYPSIVGNATVQQYATGSKTDTLNNLNNYIKFASDLIWSAATVKAANSLARQGTTVYAYIFNHTLQPNLGSEIASWFGAYHQIELNYVFGAPFLGKRLTYVADKNGTVEKQIYNDLDRAVSRKMMLLWSNFAKYGNPCGNDTSSCSWTPFKPKTADYVQINSGSMEMKTNMYKERAAYWNEKVPEMTRKWQKDKKGKEENKTRPLFGSNVIAGTLIGIFFLVPLLICNLYYCHKRNKERNVEYPSK